MHDPSRILFEQLGIALGIGLIVGLQRQFAESPLAGLRTFPLVAVLGVIAGLADRQLEACGWVVVAGFLSLTAVAGLTKSMLIRQRGAQADYGLTTEIALLLIYGLGVYLTVGDRVLAIVAGGVAAVLLQFKPELHGFVAKLGATDLRAIMTFVLVTCVVLPVLPDEAYGPFDVLNPYEIWLMVVLIVGVSLIGYIAYKLFGADAGVLLGGVLGGAVSSTATTMSCARRTAEEIGFARAAAAIVAIVAIASAVGYVRTLIEIAVIAPAEFSRLAPPLILVTASMFAAAGWAWWRTHHHPPRMPEHQNPTELRSALAFAGLYALVIWGLAASRYLFGSGGVYVVAALAGLVNTDAITISTSQLVQSGGPQAIEPDAGWRIILVALLANLAFKAGVAGLAGRWALFRRVILVFLPPAVMTIALLIVWGWVTG
jgi:uncharacterized membrane protein (DUF4010 family)